MTTRLPPLCTTCAHLLIADDYSCAAFPKEIPAPIIRNEHDHRTPYKGDKGITYAPMREGDPVFDPFARLQEGVYDESLHPRDRLGMWQEKIGGFAQLLHEALGITLDDVDMEKIEAHCDLVAASYSRFGHSPCKSNLQIDYAVHRVLPAMIRKRSPSLAKRLEQTSPRWSRRRAVGTLTETAAQRVIAEWDEPEVTAILEAAWSEAEHPRGKDGKFIEKAGEDLIPSLLSHLQMMMTMRSTMTHEDDRLVYKGYDDMVLRHGMTFPRPEKPSEREFTRTTPQECFANALHAALENDDLTYVEGWAHQGFLPVHHAWIVDSEGNVHDPTWEFRWSRAYVGIPFEDKWAMRKMVEKGSYGLLDMGGISLEEPLPEEALAKVKGNPVPERYIGVDVEVVAKLKQGIAAHEELQEAYEEALHPRDRRGRWAKKPLLAKALDRLVEIADLIADDLEDRKFMVYVEKFDANVEVPLSTMAPDEPTMGKITVGLRAISKVHRVRVPAGVEVQPVPFIARDGVHEGSYDYDDTTFPHTPNFIRVKPTSEMIELATIHEFGHYLDHMVVGRGKMLGSEHGAYPELLAAIRRTATYKHLKDLRDNPRKFSVHDGETGKPEVLDTADYADYLDYMMSDRELFARAYATWVAMRSGDEKLIEQVDYNTRRNGQMFPNAWEGEDFKEVKEEFDKLMERLGWATP